ncbi:MAG: hypothetical protein IJS90_06190 [Clostridia bacterium]|nr:hypothetical protein [Clostridia bacterium]
MDNKNNSRKQNNIDDPFYLPSLEELKNIHAAELNALLGVGSQNTEAAEIPEEAEEEAEPQAADEEEIFEDTELFEDDTDKEEILDEVIDEEDETGEELFEEDFEPEEAETDEKPEYLELLDSGAGVFDAAEKNDDDREFSDILDVNLEKFYSDAVPEISEEVAKKFITGKFSSEDIPELSQLLKLQREENGAAKFTVNAEKSSTLSRADAIKTGKFVVKKPRSDARPIAAEPRRFTVKDIPELSQLTALKEEEQAFGNIGFQESVRKIKMMGAKEEDAEEPHNYLDVNNVAQLLDFDERDYTEVLIPQEPVQEIKKNRIGMTISKIISALKTSRKKAAMF